jgi:uncharacterized protein (DUF305 family)
MKFRTLSAAAALGALAAISVTGVARAQQPAATGQAALTADQFESLYRARTDSALARFTPADVGFFTGMIHHHAQAIVMSALAPTHGASPEVQRLAARITRSQEEEIARMQKWLADRGQPVPQVHFDGLDVVVEMETPENAAGHAAHRPGQHAMATGGGAHAGMDSMEDGLMPGMLTRAQMEALDRASGREFDRLYLAGMMHHHGGAVTMVRDLFATDGAAQDGRTFKVASDIQVDQTTEIARMQRMLTEMETK